MIKHDNVHCIERPLGVITAIYPDEKGVIRAAEVEECGRRSLRPVSYLVPLELDCHHEDDELRQCLRENQRNEEDNDDDAVTMDVGQLPSERPGHQHHNWVQHEHSFSHHHLIVCPTIQLSTHANFRG